MASSLEKRQVRLSKRRLLHSPYLGIFEQILPDQITSTLFHIRRSCVVSVLRPLSPSRYAFLFLFYIHNGDSDSENVQQQSVSKSYQEVGLK